MQDCLYFRRAMRISRSEGYVDGGGGGPSTREEITGTGSEAWTLGRWVQTYLKSRTGLVAGWSWVSTSGTGEITIETGIDNDTVGYGGTVSDIVIGTYGDKYGKGSKNVHQQTPTTSWWRDYSTDILFCVLENPTKTHFINLGDNLSSTEESPGQNKCSR